MTIEYLEREKVTVDLFDSTGRISGAYFENVYIYKKYILVAYVEFDRTCLDLLSTDQQTGNSLPLGLSSCTSKFIDLFIKNFQSSFAKNVDKEFERNSSLVIRHN